MVATQSPTRGLFQAFAVTWGGLKHPYPCQTSLNRVRLNLGESYRAQESQQALSNECALKY